MATVRNLVSKKDPVQHIAIFLLLVFQFFTENSLFRASVCVLKRVLRFNFSDQSRGGGRQVKKKMLVLRRDNVAYVFMLYYIYWVAQTTGYIAMPYVRSKEIHFYNIPCKNGQTNDF